MLKKILLPVILVILAWGFWISPPFKEIAAGVSIFLLGMLSIEDGFKSFTGGMLEKVLDASTDTVWKSLGFGFITTAVMQSSSLVSLLTITFLSAGLIDLAAGLGIIFGSNVGTTTGAWLIAGIGLKVDIAAYAMPIIVFGAILLFQKDKLFKGLGAILAGIGFLFLGIAYTKTGFESFQGTLDLSQFSMTGVTGLLVYTAIGIVMTVIMQSSHATLILAIAALAAGQITYENSLAIAIGSNIGTTVTAIVGSLGANVAGKRLALAHFLFNVTMGVIALVFIATLMRMVDGISGFLRIAPDNYALKFAVFHSLFNIIGVALMTPLIPYIVKLLERLVPTPRLDISVPRYLNAAALALPDTALEAITKETGHLYENVLGLMATGLGLKESDIRSDKAISDVVLASPPQEAPDIDDLYQRHVKSLHAAIVEFASKAGENMLPEQTGRLQDIRAVARDLVLAVKDVKHLSKNTLQYVRSSNPDIAAQYNAMRMLIASVLRATTEIGVDGPISRERFAELERMVQQHDIVADGRLDTLIREGKITPGMATSLINDIEYTQNICRRLIEAGLIVLATRGEDLPTIADRGAPAAAVTGQEAPVGVQGALEG